MVEDKEVTYVNLPKIRGESHMVLGNLYRDLGWNEEYDIDTTKVILSRKDWHKYKSKFRRASSLLPTEELFELMTATGLSCGAPEFSRDVPDGKVKLMKGWLTKHNKEQCCLQGE